MRLLQPSCWRHSQLRCWSGRNSRSGIFRWLGAVSYPLYASHLAVLMMIGLAARHAGLGPNAMLAVPAVAFALMLAQFVRLLSEIRFASVIARFAARKALATTA